MPRYEVEIPGKGRFEIESPTPLTDQQAYAAAVQQIDAGKVEKPASGIFGALGKGTESALSALRAGIKGVYAPEEAALEARAREEDIARRYVDQVSLEKVQQAYRERGLLPAAGEAISQVPAAIAEQAPNIAATLGGARLGATAGAMFGPAGAFIGGIGGALAPSFFQQAGSNIQRQAAEGQPVSRAAAYGAAAPQAALDVVGTFVPLGRTLAGKALGPGVASLLAKGAEESAEKLAKETLLKTIAKGTAIGALAEIPTEVAQQMLERAQAGLPLLNEAALKEYGETAYQVGLLAPIGAAGRVAERGAARERVEAKAQDKQAEELKAKRDQAAAQRQADDAFKQTDAYATDFATKHEALQKEYDDIGAQLKQKLPAGASFADRQTFEGLKQRRGELKKQLVEQAPEYNRIKPIIEGTRAQQAQQAAQAQQARMQEEEYAGPMQQLPLPGMGPRVLDEKEAAPEPESEKIDYVAQANNLRNYLDELRTKAQTTTALADKLKLGEEYTTVEKALKDAEEQAKQEPKSVEKQIALLRKKMEVAEGEGDIPAQVRLAQKLQELGITDLAQVGAQQSFDLGAPKTLPPGETKGQFAARVYKPGAQDIEAQEQAYLEDQRFADDQARAAAETKQKVAAEVGSLQRIGQRPTPYMQYNFPPQVNAIFDRMVAETPTSQNQVFAGMAQQLQTAPETLQLTRINKNIEATQAKINESGGSEVQSTRLANLQKTRDTLEKAVYRKLFDIAESAGQGELIKRVGEPKPTGASVARKATTPVDFDARTAMYEQMLRTAKTAEDRKKAAELAFGSTPEEFAKLTEGRRPLKLFGEAEPTAREVTNTDLQTRLASLLANERLSDDAYDFLRRVERTLPEKDRDGLYAKLDSQLRNIESGQEGMAREGAARTTTLQAFPATGRADAAGATLANAEDKVRQYLFQQKVAKGMPPAQAREQVAKATVDMLIVTAQQENPTLARTLVEAKAAVNKRVSDIGKRTLRGPSVQARPLSMQAEIEPFVRDAERARDEGAGQMALFPEAQAEIVTERTTPARFQRFLDSAAAKRLREVFAPIEKKIARARERLNELNEYAADLTKTISEIEDARAVAYPAKRLKALKEGLAALKKQQVNKWTAVSDREIIKTRIAELDAVVKKAEEQEAKLVEARKKLSSENVRSLRDELAAVQKEYGSLIESVIKEGRLQEGEKGIGATTIDAYTDFFSKFNISEEDKQLLMEQFYNPSITTHRKLLATQLEKLNDTWARIDAVARVEEADKRVREYEARDGTDRSVLALAKQELRKAQAEANKLTQQLSAMQSQTAAQEAAKRRTATAINKAEEELKRIEKYKERQAELERREQVPEGTDKVGEPLRAMVYDPITDAQRAARENDTPTILVAEMQQVRGDPQQVLKGYRSRITAITKALQQAYETARTQTLEGIKERKPYEAALAAYKAAKTSVARANIEVSLSKLEKAYNAAVANALGARVMPKGLVRYQSALAEMMRREAWLADLIDKGTVAVAPPPKPRKRKTETELREIQAVLNEEEIAEAVSRAGAPALDVTATTRSEIEKARKPQGTLYSSKGVGQETAISEEAIKTRKQEQLLLKQPLTAEQRATYESNTIIKRAMDKRARKAPLDELEKLLLSEYDRSRLAKKADLLRQNKFKPGTAEEATETSEAEAPTSEEIRERALEAERAEFDAEEVADTGFFKNSVEDLDAMFDKPETLEQLAATTSQGPALKSKIDTEESAAAVMQNIAKNSSSEISRAIAERLKLLLGSTRVEIVRDLRDADGQAAYGQAAVDGSFIRLDANFGLNERTVLHEGIHAGVERVLQMPESQLTEQQLNAKRELEELFEAYRNLKDATNENAKTSLSEFASEALSDSVMQAEMRAQKWTLRHMWDSFKSSILRMLGIKTPTNMRDAALAAVDNLLTKVPRPTAADNALLAPKVVNRPRNLNPALNQADAIARQIVAGRPSITQKARALGSGLALEIGLVDRFAGFERLSKYMPKLIGNQMMYYLRMYDQRMNFTSQSAANGALELREVQRRDGEREFIVESKAGPSLKGVVTTLKRAKAIVGDVDATSRLFSLYLIAKRAERVGFDKLDIDDPQIKQKVLDAMAQINALPELQSVFDDARDTYNQYNENLVRFAQQAGVFNKNDADALLRAKDYVPYYRERNGIVELTLGGMQPVKIGNIKDMPHLQELVGGDQRVLDFMVSSVQNTNMMVDMALRNLATRNAMFELTDMGLAKITPKPVDGANVVRFKHNGEDRYAILETDRLTVGGKMVDTGVPADLLVKGMEGIPVQTTGMMRVMTVPTHILRKAVTLNPLYMLRQLARDSLSATIGAGADMTPVMGALKEIGSSTKETLERRGITGGQIFTGTTEDISVIMRSIVGGQSNITKAIGALEWAGMEADALTRRAQYNSYIKQGMSEMEATLLSLESMNFNKRGASPSVHLANSLYPFFNAQIQGLNVLYRAMFGQITAAEKARLKQKFITRGAMMMATSLAYAHAMQDDEAYKNALPAEKYSNWFVRLPGVAEPLRIPIPFEIGYIFKALPEAIYNTIVNEKGAEEAKEAFAGILRNVIPGGSSYFIPQVMRPAIEVATNHSFFTDRPLLSTKEQQLLPEYQYRNSTTEAAKLFGGAAGVSPVKLEALVSGYLSTMGLVLLQTASVPISAKESPDKAERRLSEMPVVGSAFQPNDARWVINSTYDSLAEARKVQTSFKELINRGERAEAKSLLDARANDYARAELEGFYRTEMGKLSQYRTAINASNKSPQEKRAMLDTLRQYEIKLSGMVRQSSDAVKLNEKPRA